MYVAGLDVGAIFVKAAIMGDQGVIHSALYEVGSSPKASIERCLSSALKGAGLGRDQLSRIVATGHGRNGVPFATNRISEMTALVRAAHAQSPGIPLVADVGGQGIRVMRLSGSGALEKFVTNDKCSAGTGCFLDTIALAMAVQTGDLGRLSETSKSPSCMSTTCTIFAESEVISLIARGSSKEDIVAGLHMTVALKVSNLVRSMGEGKVLMAGGVMRNHGVVKALKEQFGPSVQVAMMPQMMTVVGAAIIAYEGEGGLVS